MKVRTGLFAKSARYEISQFLHSDPTRALLTQDRRPASRREVRQVELGWDPAPMTPNMACDQRVPDVSDDRLDISTS